MQTSPCSCIRGVLLGPAEMLCISFRMFRVIKSHKVFGSCVQVQDEVHLSSINALVDSVEGPLRYTIH